MVVVGRTYEAQSLLDAIVDELGEADSFTRDDLLYLDVFGHVSTITRYNYVRRAVRLLVEQGRLHEYGYQLILPNKEKAFRTSRSKVEEYYHSAALLVHKHGRKWRSFAVSDILHEWTTDTHLTTSTKRTLLRQILQTMKREGHIHQFEEYVYRYTMFKDGDT